MRIALLSVLIVVLVSCAAPQKEVTVIKKEIKPKTKSELILGTWKCEDRLKVGELNMHFLFDETYSNNGDYNVSGTLRADFQIGNEVMAYRLKSSGTWYFSNKDQINYKIDEYELSGLSDKYNELSMNPKDYIPKSSSYSLTLLNLSADKLETQLSALAMDKTVCKRK